MAGNENYTEYQRQSPGDLAGVTDHVTKIDRQWALNHVGLVFHAILQVLGTSPSGLRDTLGQRLLDIEDAATIVKAAVAPSSPVTNKIWHDTDNNAIKQWDGDSWETVALVLPEGGTTGDVITKTADGVEWSAP